MDVTPLTWTIAITGFVLMALLMALQLIAVVRSRNALTIQNAHGGDTEATDPKACFAFNQGHAYADVFFWGPIQLVGCIGMVLGARWGFLLALLGSVPFWCSAMNLHTYRRQVGFTELEPALLSWVVIWGIWPAFGIAQMVYCFGRLLG
jgi:hypothetical protein